MLAVEIGGNANFDGDFYFTNPDAQLWCSGSLQIAGEVGSDALANHVFAGVEPVPFPTPDTEMFKSFATGPYPDGEEFASLAGAAGTSILAPGFAVSFTGNFSVIDGVVAAGSLHFASNASAEVKGTLITYATEPFVVDGNISFNFDRAAGTRVPGGFDTHRVLTNNPSSCAMVF